MRLEPVGDAHLGGGVWNAMLELRVSPAQLVERGGQFEAVCVGRIGRSQNRRALWRFQSLSKQQLLTLLPNGTLDQQFARRTQPVVGAHPGYCRTLTSGLTASMRKILLDSTRSISDAGFLCTARALS